MTTPPFPRPPHDASPPHRVRQVCITDFLTDGSLLRVCDAAQRLTGFPVSLHDAAGRLVVHGDGERVFALQPDGPAPPPHSTSELTAPLRTVAGVIGAITVALPETAPDPAIHSNIEEFIVNLAATVAEVCDGQLLLRRRVDELGVLYKLSSMLVGATTVDAVLKAALDSAVSMLHADAGSIRILDQERHTLQLRASAGLSDTYLTAAGALPADRACDKEALAGTVVEIRDIHARGDFLHLHDLDAEGVRSLASVGLVFRGETLGLLRLYHRHTNRLNQEERDILQSIAQQIAAAVANARLLESEADARRVKRQLTLASEVQRRMLPDSLPTTARLDIAARYESCFELGGDFYDAFRHGHARPGEPRHQDQCIALALGDVVGKGVPAALLMSAVRATIRAHARDVVRVDEVMALTNQALCRDTLVNEFATVFFGVINPETLNLSYCNAGHEPPLIIHVPTHRPPTSADIDELPVGGMVLGVDASQRYQQGAFDLAIDDVLLIYSDGLPDAMNFDGAKFGKRRVREALLDILRLDPSASADRITTHILWEMRRFTGLARQTDDTTILVVRTRNTD